jgi:hypothetical protein
MLVGRRDVAVDRHGDVLHPEHQVVVLGGDGRRPLHAVGILEQRDQMAGPVVSTVRWTCASEQM